MAQTQEEKKIKVVLPPRVKRRRAPKEIPEGVLKRGMYKVKKVTNIGYVPALIYPNGEELIVGPVDYVIIYDPRTGTRKIISGELFGKAIQGKIVVPVSIKDFAQKVFILAELGRLGGIRRYYYLVRPELIPASSKKNSVEKQIEKLLSGA